MKEEQSDFKVKSKNYTPFFEFHGSIGKAFTTSGFLDVLERRNSLSSTKHKACLTIYIQISIEHKSWMLWNELRNFYSQNKWLTQFFKKEVMLDNNQQASKDKWMYMTRL